MVTVYFDSNFYVWLGRESDDEIADLHINKLNSLQVRHVVSLPLIQELFSSSPRPDTNHHLHSRVTRLIIPPLQLIENFTWDALIYPQQMLNQFAQILRWADDMATGGHSHSLMASRALTAEQQEKWNQANPHIAALVRNVGNGQDQAKAVAFARALIEQMRTRSPTMAINFDDVVAALEEPKPDLCAISQMIFAALGEDTVAKLKEERKLQESVTASDSRPLNLTLGAASQQQRKRLANTLRDAAHMALFVEHADKIDFLQVDGAQMQQIRKSSPTHRLVERGLDGRCFTATSLGDVVETISNMIARSGGVSQ